MTKPLIKPSRRLMIGRRQKNYKNTFNLLRSIRTETLSWSGLIVLAMLNIAIFLAFIAHTLGINFFELIAVINNLVSQGTSIDPNGFNPSQNTEFTPQNQEAPLNLSPFELIVVLISTRVLFNIVFAIILRKGIEWHQPLINRIIAITQAILSSAIFFIVLEVFFQINIFIYKTLDYILVIHGLAFGELSTVKSKAIMLLIDVDVIIAYILILSILVLSLFNTIRSIMVFVDTFNLLARTSIIDKDYRITSLHEKDLEYLKDFYISSSHVEGTKLTDKDFEDFMNSHTMNDFRVLLKNGVPAGFYATGSSRTVLEEVIIGKEHQNLGLGEHLLKDFEFFAKKRKPTTLTARFYSEDLKTAKYLSERGWTETSVEGMNQKEFQKTI